MIDYLRLLVYKLIGRLALWTGRFYTLDEHQRKLALQAEEFKQIILSEERTARFRLRHRSKTQHKSDMEDAFMFGFKSMQKLT